MARPLYDRIEFCRDPETLWGKLESKRYDWLGVHPKGQFVVGSPPVQRFSGGAGSSLARGGAPEGEHGFRIEGPLEHCRDCYRACDREFGKGGQPSGDKLYELTWAAHGNFYNEPAEYVLDAGLYAERFSAQPTYIRTDDGKIVFSYGEAHTGRYIVQHAVPMLEASVFARQWESSWAKMPEIGANARLELISAAIAYYSAVFDFVPATAEPQLPDLTLAL